MEKEFLESVSSSKISVKEMRNSFLPEQEEEPAIAVRALWRAVITQALMDAGSNAKKPELKKEKARAISWLNGDSDDFIEVCTMADYEPSEVRKKAKEAIKNGCKWRIENNPFIKNKIERKFFDEDEMEDLSIKMLRA